MFGRSLVGGLIVFGMASTSALAQNSLGELLDGGAKKLTKEALQSALSGAQVSGKSVTGASTEYSYKADGSFSGDFGPQVATSLSLLALALNYRFLPIYER